MRLVRQAQSGAARLVRSLLGRTLERPAVAREHEMSELLLDIEGTLLAYWTDIPEAEIQRLLPKIRAALAGEQP